jgi:hypothetical protein
MRAEPRRLVRLAAVVLATVAAAPSSTGATSKTKVVAIGDPAPGGGVFAGPSFTANPAAAGSGWIAFRTRIEGGSTSEAILVRRMLAPVTIVEVARIGQRAPGAAGTFREFVGRPAVNTAGDVAFMALLTTGGEPDDPTAPAPAGVFLYRQTPPGLVTVALSGQAMPEGVLDLAAPLDPVDDDDAVDGQRTPAVNDLGAVAFLSALRGGPQTQGAIFVRSALGAIESVVGVGQTYDGGTFSRLGPPAINANGVVAFHGTVAAEPPLDGIFTASAGTVALVVGSSHTVHTPLPTPREQTLTEFEDPVALNDLGDVTFAAGPLTDPNSPESASPGAFLAHAGMVFPLAYPGQTIGSSRVTSLRLGPQAGGGLAAPAVDALGNAYFFASLNGGSSEVVGRVAAPSYDAVERLVVVGGGDPDETPAGGTFQAVESPVAVDALGGVAFLARVAGGATSEALVYREVSGAIELVPVGDASPTRGFFAGPPFSTPLLNQRGDVVFRAFVARGPTSVGIFRSAAGQLDAVARVGDPSPTNGAPYVDLLGQPSLNAGGAVAFTAEVQGIGRGIYVVEPGGARTVVLRGDPAPAGTGARFLSLAPNPVVNDAGAVAFRASIRFTAEDGGTVTTEGLFLAEGAAVRLIALADQPSPAGPPFRQLRDPALSGVPSLAFRADLGGTTAAASGLFLADLTGTRAVALQNDHLGGGVTLSSFSGAPSVDASGRVAFLANRARGGQGLGPAILAGTTGALDLVVARNMPGPAGGIFRSLGVPSMNAAGHIAFRGSFLPQTGGAAGVFFADGAGVRPYLSVGETTPIGGRFASFNARGTLNDNDEYAFVANVSRGDARNAIFVASPTTLAVRRLALGLSGGRRRDRVRMKLVFTPGRLSNGLRPGDEALTVSLADAAGTLWTETIPAAAFRSRGRVLAVETGPARERKLRGVRLAVRKNTARLTLAAHGLDLTGTRQLVPPLTVGFELGDDSGVRAATCTLRRRSARCRPS